MVLIIALLVLLTLTSWLVSAWTDWLWFDEVGYTSVFSRTLQTRSLLFGAFGLGMALWVAINLYLAYRLRPALRPNSPEQLNLDRYRMVVTPRIGLYIGLLAAFCGLITGLSAQAKWPQWMLFRNSVPFGQTDPQFHWDASFYVFEYPFWRYLVGVGFWAVFIGLLGAMFAHWLYGGLRLQGRGDRITRSARLHLSILVALFVLLKAAAYFLDQRGLVLDHNDVTGLTGGGYADINALLPAKEILTWIAVIVAAAVVLFSNAVIRTLVWPGVALGLLVVSAIVIGGVYPAIVTTFEVKPNVVGKEADYTQRTIQATRAAYGLNLVEQQRYDSRTTIPTAELPADRGTVPDIRLLDPSVLSETYTQLQQSRSFYDFGEKLDVDRYTTNGATQDYVVGVRELNSAKLLGNQTNWQNRHTVFTHGYGFVAAPANQVVCAGQPFFVSGFLGQNDDNNSGPNDNGGNQAGCLADTEQIQVKQQRIYYGELVGDFSIVGKADASAKDAEFDRPASSESNAEQINFSYDGKGGVAMNSIGRRLLYALYFRDKNFLLSDVFNDNSKLMYIRDPRARVEKVAPFLTADGDPYPAVVNGRVTWILDAYTTSETYPYAQRIDLQDATSDSLTGTGTAQQARREINYIRNSVKATVDAYDGTVTLYSVDDKDPVMRAWNSAFGGIIKPQRDLPTDLAEHFRYPEDLFKIQRDMLVKFHVSNPREFLNQQDFWEIPRDPTDPGSGKKQPPYYVVAQYPNQEQPTFQLTAAVTARGRQNLAALLSAHYDNEGKPSINVLELPGDTLTQGPVQVQPKMQNAPNARQDLTLFESQNSRVVYGNLLTLPVGGGLLYVEPVYIQGRDENAYPLMKKVLAAYGDYVAYADTVPQALQSLVDQAAGRPPSTTTPPSSTQNPPTSNAGSPALTAAVAKINKALSDLRAAQQKGDVEAYGKALTALQAAVTQYEAAQKAAGTASPSPAPSASGSPRGSTSPTPSKPAG